MCKWGKEQATYRSPHPNWYFHSNSNLKDSNKESDFGEEEEEEVPVQPKTERTLKSSSDSTLVPKDIKVSDVETLDGTFTALQGLLDHLNTCFGMKLASFLVSEYRKRIMYIWLQCKGPASD